MQINENKLILNGISINYYSISEAQNPSCNFVFLHGWRLDSTSWFDILNQLAQKNSNVYCIDLPGFGKSELPKTAFSVSDYALVAKEFIEKLGLKNVCIVGHSVGGRIAIKFSVNYPELLQKLVLVDSAGIKNRSFYLSVTKVLAKLLSPVFKPRSMQKIKKKLYLKLGASDYVETPELRSTFVNIIEEDLTSSLVKISVPTLIIWGKNDTEVPMKFANIMKKEIKNSELIVFENAGHLPFYDKPQEFIDSLLKFCVK